MSISSATATLNHLTQDLAPSLAKVQSGDLAQKKEGISDISGLLGKQDVKDALSELGLDTDKLLGFVGKTYTALLNSDSLPESAGTNLSKGLTDALNDFGLQFTNGSGHFDDTTIQADATSQNKQTPSVRAASQDLNAQSMDLINKLK